MPNLPILNFSKGEIAPVLYGRIDTEQRNAGLKTARNFVVQKYGGLTFRPGTRLVGVWDDPTLPLRFVPFQFSINQSYVLTFGQGMMRPVALGGFVLEANTKITAITLGNPTRLTIPFHGLSTGDRTYLSGIEGTTELNGRVVEVTKIDDNTVAIPVNSTGFGAFVSSDGTLNAAPPDPPPTPPVVPPPVPDPIPPEFAGLGNDPPWWKFVPDPHFIV